MRGNFPHLITVDLSILKRETERIVNFTVLEKSQTVENGQER